MKITVITVTRNALQQLKTTMESIRSQDYSDIETIVIDGASTDGTAEYLTTVKDSIRYLSEPDKGIYDAMNKGISMASGDYCIFMNSADTFATPDTVSKVVASGMKADVIYGDIIKNGVVKSAQSPRNGHRMYYCHQAAFVRTTLLRAYPFDIRHKMSADFKQAKQLFLAGKSFRHIDIPIANFDTNGVSNTNRSDGLLDNIRIICEVDTPREQLRLLPRLTFTYLMCRLRGK